MSTTVRETVYYTRELVRRLRHYAAKRRYGYRDRGTLEDAAETILERRLEGGLEAGSHFQGVWPRDLCFSAPGLSALGGNTRLRETAEWVLESVSTTSTFFTDLHATYAAATPAEGVDTFPALVIVLAEAGGLADNAERVAALAALHRETFFDPETGLVTGAGSSWWDSAAAPRETYNTAMLLAAVDRLEAAGLETAYADHTDRLRDGLSRLWTGHHFAEHRKSAVLACDANVVPLYFRLVDDDRARAIADSLAALETPVGLKMRARPFSPCEVHPFFLLHRDYHYHVWPWNSLLYAIGLDRYGLEERARRERTRVEAVLGEYGNFLEVYTLAGEPYCKRGYASAEDFTVAAALWVQYRNRGGGGV